MATKRDANDVLREEGRDALRAEHDKAERWRSNKRRRGQGQEERPQGESEDAQENSQAKDDGNPTNLKFADEEKLPEATDDVVRGVIPARAIGITIGRSSAGKTFLMLELAFCIAHGKSFFGRKVRQGAVLYVALEGQGEFARRVIAARERHGVPGKRFARLTAPIILGRNPASQASTRALVNAAKRLQQEAGCPVVLIEIDTYARALAGDDEQLAAAVAAVFSQLQIVIAETGASVVLVHHPGKDATKGARGSSALFSGADFEIEVNRDDNANIRRAAVTKVRDGIEGPLGNFNLKTTVIGRNQDGDDVTSCTVDTLTDAPVSRPRRPHPESQAGRALNELEHLLIDGKGEVSRGHPRIPDDAVVVKRADWAAACRAKHLSDGDAESEKKAFRRAKKALSAGSLIGQHGEAIWLLGGHSGPKP